MTDQTTSSHDSAAAMAGVEPTTLARDAGAEPAIPAGGTAIVDSGGDAVLVDPAVAPSSDQRAASIAGTEEGGGDTAATAADTEQDATAATDVTAETDAGPGFVHLRLRSEYSVVDSIVRIDDAVDAALADDQPALALSDAFNLFGWVKFYKKAAGKGIQPICAVDVWVSNLGTPERPHRLLLIAASNAGYRRLCELISKAWLENEKGGHAELRPEWLTADSTTGLIALSGAVGGEVGRHLLAGNQDKARAAARHLAEVFPDAFYLEVQRDGSHDAETCTRATARLAAEMGLPLVATHPIQFLAADEFRAHEARVCIAEGEVLADPKRVRRFTPEQYFKTRAQMMALFADLPAALANSVEIARRCAVTLTLGKPQLPVYATPEGVSIEDYLRQQAAEGLVRRLEKLFPDPAVRAAKQPEYDARLQRECDTIIGMGFPGYFLIVADFICWAKQNGVPVGPGRGSGAGSLVAFALGITDLDPLPYALLFERFLNPERVSMPDFDIDFCQDKRGRVIEYVRRKYGHDAVSQIATFGTMASKAVIRDAGRVLDMPYNFCDQLSKLIPIEQAKPLSLDKALKAEPVLAERLANEEEVAELFALARPLEDLTRNIGMHAGGVLIAPGKLTDFCPLYQAPGTSSVVSQYDKDDVEAVGLVKFDFLGLRNLTIIDLAVEYVNQRRQREGQALLELDELGFDDQDAYQILRDGNTVAIFQVESDGMKKLLRKLQPDRFEDIIAVLALYRPGPLGSGMVDDFILRKRGEQEIDYFHPNLKDCLEPTYGVIVYQEQVMQISQIIAGYTLGGADLLRRAMGKKKPEEMAKQRQIFMEGAEKLGQDLNLASQLFDLMEKFAEYGFNKSHTAAYAVVTYHTAWLKAHYPAEFMAATLSSDMDDTDKVQIFVRDAQHNKVEVQLPDINDSAYRFEPAGPRAIRYGLGGIKGLGQSAIENIVEARHRGGPFIDLFDFCERIDRRLINRRSIEALVRAGAFDKLDRDRAKLMANVPQAMEAAEQRAREREAGQGGLFGDDFLEDGGAPMREWLPATPWDERQRLLEEKTALGYFLSGHLFDASRDEVRRFVKTRIDELEKLVGKHFGAVPVTVAGIVSSLSTAMTRRGKMVRVVLDDGSGAEEIAIFSEAWDQYRHLLKEDQLVVVHGKLSKDDYSGGHRFSVERVLDLGTARGEHARALKLTIAGRPDAVRLKDMLTPYRVDGAKGEGCPVEIHYYSDCASAALRLGHEWAVRPDDALLAGLRSWLSEARVEMRYR
ncbi:MAG: DNA polymerase III subunit alpha [Lautropia sp.]|nr:DNA polymerase III subunit alpha [Lautropia sp.]